MVFKKYTLSFCFTFISLLNFAQNTFVPDDNFEQALIDLGYDVGPLNDLVPTANINTVTNIDITAKNISDLTGVEDFAALSVLTCEDNSLSALNLIQNSNLTQLFCSRNLLTNLDVTQNTNLSILWCAENQINSLDVSQNTGLISLVCGNNQIPNLNISQNPSLNVLVCSDNQISSLNVSNNNNISRFECENNLINSLVITNITNLSVLNCSNNQITSLNTSNNNRLANLNCAFNEISQLDLSRNSNLVSLNARNNILCSLNIQNANNNAITFMDFSSNPELDCVVVDNPSGNHSGWQPASFSNYVSSQTACNNAVNVDRLNSVIVRNFYTLPNLVNGNYFTQSGGNGLPLIAGETISTSQTLYIYAENRCSSNESSFSVLINDSDYFIPKYFTPNNDGYHDVWKVIDNTNTIETITIYNRYGKLLKYLPSNSQGWNGIFNGQLLNSDDYWYLITLFSGKTLKGHFTLKR